MAPVSSHAAPTTNVTFADVTAKAGLQTRIVYGATGIGKTHLGLTFADHGRTADGARGVVLDMNGRGDSQQHDEYAQRLFDWDLRPWRHTVMPMSPVLLIV